MVLGGVVLSVPLLCALPAIILVIVAACVNLYLVWDLSSHEISIDQPVPAPTEVSIVEPMATLSALATQVAVLSNATPPPPIPTSTPRAPLAYAPFTAPDLAFHPLADFTIEGLQGRTYPGGTLRVRSVMTVTRDFTRYYIDYPSDDLTITGIMQVPHGEGPFPVIILNHGYVPRDNYWSGADTWNAAEFLNRRGYLTIAPDFRSWGESDMDDSFFSTGQVIDALNLISSLSSIREADPQRVGMWGHSMGGGVTTKAITIDTRIRAAVLYAPVSADDAKVMARWGTGCQGGEPGEAADECAGAEVLTNDLDERLHLAYTSAASDPLFMVQVSPINYFHAVVAPLQIHIGTQDTTTPPEWSDEIHQALQAAGKETEYYSYPGQGHSFEGRDWQLFMERVADFFDRHLANAS